MARKPTIPRMTSGASPLGEPVSYVRPPRPEPVELRGRHVVLRPLDPAADAGELFACSHPPDGDPAVWTYLFDGPFASASEMRASLEEAVRSDDYVVFTVVPISSRPPLPRGSCSYLRITPEHGVIEIGSIWFAASLQRSTATTEAIYLLARHAFDQLGYRRLEWKCNALNAPSRRAAERFGFAFEGVFEQHMIAKSRNRDTAWFAITDKRWPAVRSAFETWLSPSNFDADGRQHLRLGDLTWQSRE
jgi:RimJ/RimL family protein N-acetyltransferase